MSRRRSWVDDEIRFSGEVQRRRFWVEDEFRISGEVRAHDFGLTTNFGFRGGETNGGFGLTTRIGFRGEAGFQVHVKKTFVETDRSKRGLGFPGVCEMYRIKKGR